jgi:endogenous inhibitor of DNA gyrase (YacG/DUF329 family)
MIDLGRWLSEEYRIPGEEVRPPGRPSEGEDPDDDP